MKRKQSLERAAKQGKRSEPGHNESAAKAVQGSGDATEKLQAVNVPTEYVPAPPDVVFADAEQEADRRQLREYSDSIRLLREKGFTFREIAEWLHDYGIEADHNAVYRVYLNTVHPADVVQLEQELEREEMEDQA
jgi:hypothetical protein